jgi:hypothetical protein
MIVNLMDLTLVGCLHKPLDVLVEEWPPELFQELHLDGINLLVP